MTTIPYMGNRYSERLCVALGEKIMLFCAHNGTPGVSPWAIKDTNSKPASPAIEAARSEDTEATGGDDYWYSDWQAWTWLPPARN